MKSNQRDQLIDALKAYACLLVVVGHVLMGIRKMGTVTLLPGMELLEEFLYTFHVALFMFLSGCVYRITGQPTAKGSRLDFIKNKALNLGIPYVVFSVVYIIVNSVVGGYEHLILYKRSFEYMEISNCSILVFIFLVFLIPNLGTCVNLDEELADNQLCIHSYSSIKCC